MVCLRAGKVQSVDLEEAVSRMKLIEPGSEIVRAARAVGATLGDGA